MTSLFVVRGDDTTVTLGPFMADGDWRDITGWTVTLVVTPRAQTPPGDGVSYTGVVTGDPASGMYATFDIPGSDLLRLETKWFDCIGVDTGGRRTTLDAGPFAIEAAPRVVTAPTPATAIGLAAHLADATDAHDASAISFAPMGSVGSTDVQAAIVEVAADAATADASLAASIATNAATLAALTAGEDPSLDTFIETYTRFLADESVASALAATVAGKATDAAVVHLTGAETVPGTKTFTDVYLATAAFKHRPFADVTHPDFGASTALSDCGAAFAAAQAAAVASGGKKVWVPPSAGFTVLTGISLANGVSWEGVPGASKIINDATIAGVGNHLFSIAGGTSAAPMKDIAIRGLAVYAIPTGVWWPLASVANNGAGLIRVVTLSPHTFSTGNTVTVKGSVDSANGTRTITVINATTFDLVGSAYVESSTGGHVNFNLNPEQAVQMTGVIQRVTLENLLCWDHQNFAITYGGGATDTDPTLFSFDGLILKGISIGGDCGADGDGSGINIFCRAMQTVSSDTFPAARNLTLRDLQIDVTRGYADHRYHGPQCVKVNNTRGVIGENLQLIGGDLSALTLNNGVQSAHLSGVTARRANAGIIVNALLNTSTCRTQNITLDEVSYDPEDGTGDKRILVIGQVPGFVANGVVGTGDIYIQDDIQVTQETALASSITLAGVDFKGNLLSGGHGTGVTSVDTTADTFTLAAHGLANGTAIYVAGTVLPAPLSTIVQYFVVGATADTFQLALTAGGAAIDLTTSGTNVSFTRVLPHMEGFRINGTLRGGSGTAKGRLLWDAINWRLKGANIDITCIEHDGDACRWYGSNNTVRVISVDGNPDNQANIGIVNDRDYAATSPLSVGTSDVRTRMVSTGNAGKVNNSKFAFNGIVSALEQRLILTSPLVEGLGTGNTTVNTTIDLANGNVHDRTLAVATTTFTFAGAFTAKACAFTLILRQDGTGGRAVVWPASVKWSSGSPPTISTTASAIDAYTFVTTDGGVTWLGAVVGAAFA